MDVGLLLADCWGSSAAVVARLPCGKSERLKNCRANRYHFCIWRSVAFVRVANCFAMPPPEGNEEAPRFL